MAKNTIIVVLIESCIEAHRASKSSWALKIKGYNPRKRPKMSENTTFADPNKVVYRGSQGIEILPGLENHGL